MPSIPFTATKSAASKCFLSSISKLSIGHKLYESPFPFTGSFFSLLICYTWELVVGYAQRNWLHGCLGVGFTH